MIQYVSYQYIRQHSTCLVFISITYWMMGLNDDFIRFLIAMGIVLLVSNAAMSIGYFASAIAPGVSFLLLWLLRFCNTIQIVLHFNFHVLPIRRTLLTSFVIFVFSLFFYSAGFWSNWMIHLSGSHGFSIYPLSNMGLVIWQSQFSVSHRQNRINPSDLTK